MAAQPAPMPRHPLSPRGIRESLHLSRERMGRVMDVSSKTIERWEARDTPPPSPAVRARLAKIREIVDLGLAVYGSEGLAEFLATPLPEFDGYTALQLIEMGQAERVLSALAADYEGLGA